MGSPSISISLSFNTIHIEPKSPLLSIVGEKKRGIDIELLSTVSTIVAISPISIGGKFKLAEPNSKSGSQELWYGGNYNATCIT